MLIEDDIFGNNVIYKMNLLLRSIEDREVLLEGLLDGIIDCIVIDYVLYVCDEKV